MVDLQSTALGHLATAPLCCFVSAGAGVRLVPGPTVFCVVTRRPVVCRAASPRRERHGRPPSGSPSPPVRRGRGGSYRCRYGGSSRMGGLCRSRWLGSPQSAHRPAVRRPEKGQSRKPCRLCRFWYGIDGTSIVRPAGRGRLLDDRPSSGLRSRAGAVSADVFTRGVLPPI